MAAATEEEPAESALGAEAGAQLDNVEASSASGPADADGQEAAPQVGIFGKLKERAGKTVEKVGETQTALVDKYKEVQQRVIEAERVQQSVQYVKQKTTELAENERVQKGLEVARGTAKAVSERTQNSLEAARETAKAMKQGVVGVWQQGGGSIQRVRSKVSGVAWRGSARDTLAMQERMDQWKDIKVHGAEELVIPARTEHTSAYHVSRGSTLRWTFRVKDNDVGFGVRMRVQEWGGSREEEVLPIERYDCQDTISGSWVADQDRTMILAFDNKYSRLRSKTVAYYVGSEKPPVVAEPQPAPAAAATAETAEGGQVAAPAVGEAVPKPKAIV